MQGAGRWLEGDDMVAYWHNDSGAAITDMSFANVWVDRRPLRPTPAERRKSPTGYGWGYMGAGPHALAMAILRHATGSPAEAEAWAQEFKRQHVATWGDGWRISRGAVLRWLQFAQRGIDAPQVWVNAPPAPPIALYEWLSEQTLETYCDVARLAYFRADGILGDLLEEHGQPREWASSLCANLPDSWLDETPAPARHPDGEGVRDDE